MSFLLGFLFTEDLFSYRIFAITSAPKKILLSWSLSNVNVAVIVRLLQEEIGKGEASQPNQGIQKTYLETFPKLYDVLKLK